MKRCFKCGAEKPLSEFYAHPRMADGHLNKCKECNKNDAHKHHRKMSQEPDWVEAQRARGRDKYARLYQSERQRRLINGSPTAKHVASYAVGNAVRDGRMVKPTTCSQCKRKVSGRFMHAHHEDYGKTYDVIWLCAKCHSNIHYEERTA